MEWDEFLTERKGEKRNSTASAVDSRNLSRNLAAVGSPSAAVVVVRASD